MAKRTKRRSSRDQEVVVVQAASKPCPPVTATGFPDIAAARAWIKGKRCGRGCVEIGSLIICQAGNCTAIRLCRRK